MNVFYLRGEFLGYIGMCGLRGWFVGYIVYNLGIDFIYFG